MCGVTKEKMYGGWTDFWDAIADKKDFENKIKEEIKKEVINIQN